MSMSKYPRKAIVASLMFGPYGVFPGLEKRLDELEAYIEEIAGKSEQRYQGRSPDIVALPEVIVSGGLSGPASECSFRLEGPILDRFSSAARKHGCYITIPLYLEEEGIYRNSIVLVDRSGDVAGIYHKFHPVIGHDGVTLEGGILPGDDHPVFECDFGNVGFQICFDISFDDGWSALKTHGAELVIWSTQSPQTARPAALALRERYFIVSSTWRNNLCLFEPTGMVAARVDEPEDMLIQEIDLSYVILPWSGKLRNGAYLQERYGNKIGFRYYESEDCGVFWSNDESKSIEEIAEEAELEPINEMIERSNALQSAERERSRKGAVAQR